MSLTAVENLADACLAAGGWAPGAYNIADAVAYERDAAVRCVLRAHGVRAGVRHVPVAVARAAARGAEVVGRARPGREPVLTRYAVDQLACGLVLDISRAHAQGWTPFRTLASYTP
jgi:nucleoside-diphosphate-sugar epimerase